MGTEDLQPLLNEQQNIIEITTPPKLHDPSTSPIPADYAFYPPQGYPFMYPIQVSSTSVESQYMMPAHSYPPQYLHYHTYVQQPQGFDNCKNGSILSGVTPNHIPMVQKEVPEQSRDFPNGLIASLKMKLPVYNELKPSSAWGIICFCLLLQSFFRFSIALTILNTDRDFYSILILILFSFMGTFVSFLLFNGILHGMCMCFGGGLGDQSGSALYTQLCYFSAMFCTPIDLFLFALLISFIGAMLLGKVIGVVIILVFFSISIKYAY